MSSRESVEGRSGPSTMGQPLRVSRTIGIMRPPTCAGYSANLRQLLHVVGPQPVALWTLHSTVAVAGNSSVPISIVTFGSAWTLKTQRGCVGAPPAVPATT